MAKKSSKMNCYFICFLIFVALFLVFKKLNKPKMEGYKDRYNVPPFAPEPVKYRYKDGGIKKSAKILEEELEQITKYEEDIKKEIQDNGVDARHKRELNIQLEQNITDIKNKILQEKEHEDRRENDEKIRRQNCCPCSKNPPPREHSRHPPPPPPRPPPRNNRRR